ncbi:MAG: hypothetical protein WBG54_23125 [Acidobacteriaceae bacterium]
MPELRVAIDPCNPGQFYACCGLIELLDLAGTYTLSRFYMDRYHPREAEFVVESERGLDLDFIASAIKQATFTPASVDKPPYKDSIAPVSVSVLNHDLDLDWWLNEFRDQATPLKCWAGQVTTQKLTSELPKLLPTAGVSFDGDGFTSTRFGIDPRSAWVALDLGYSPNEQGQESRTYPIVELLAAFGLQGFRPTGSRAQGFTYALWLEPLPRIVARSAGVRPWEGLPAAQYGFKLGVRGSYKFFCFANPILV